jgi:peroxiredoxin Q/BCP
MGKLGRRCAWLWQGAVGRAIIKESTQLWSAVMVRISSLVVTAALALTASSVTAQASDSAAGTVVPSAPAVGVEAPDFTAAWADANGPKVEPVQLSDLRGKVVVLAFYPLDRSRGCTIELQKFRDEYTKLFGEGAGEDVVVLPVSVDSIESHVSWINDAKFPFALVSDGDQTVAKLYGSTSAGRPYNSRTVFVIDREGKITYRNLRFGALNEQAYTDLAAAVAAAKGM